MTSPNPAPVKYHTTAKNLMMWANSELQHVGRIIGTEDPKIQYTYALSTVYGMAHLKDAIFEYVSDNSDSPMKKDLLTVHEQVIRVMKHLIKDFNLDISAIEAFNTKHTLSSLKYLKGKSRKNRKTRKSTRKVRK